jgi:hypothetical protein
MNGHAMLYQILTEAEDRAACETYPAEVRERSAETVALCEERMRRENLTRDELKRLAGAK